MVVLTGLLASPASHIGSPRYSTATTMSQRELPGDEAVGDSIIAYSQQPQPETQAEASQ